MFEFRIDNFYKTFAEQEKSRFLGFADLAFVVDGVVQFKVKSIKLYQRKDNDTFYLGFPSSKAKNEDKWYDNAFPTTAEAREAITNLVVEKAKAVWDQQNS